MNAANPSASVDDPVDQWEVPLWEPEADDPPYEAEFMAGGLRVDGDVDGVLELSVAGLEDVKTGLGLWHTDPAESVLLAIVIIVAAAKVGEMAARRLGLPQVLGELVMGMILGNVYFFSGWDFFNFLREMSFMKILSEIGIIVLLLMVGVHMDLRAMLRVGPAAFLIAFVGILAPGGLGYLAGHFLLPDEPLIARLFLAASLCGTSIAINLRVFHELNRLQSIEARVAIGAAVVIDIAALLILVAISGIAMTGQFSPKSVAVTGASAVAFLGGLGMVSLWFGEGFGDFVTRRCPEGIKVFIVAVVCLGLAFFAEFIGLATIVGALVAGLLLKHIKVKSLIGKDRSMEELIQPTYMILVPIFFVLVGARVRLDSFMDADAALLGLSVIGAAILGRLICTACVIKRGVNRLAVAVSIIPRGEVALVIGTVGKGMEVLSDTMFSAIVMVVAVTVLSGPPLLKLILTRSKAFVSEGPLVPYGLSDDSRRRLVMLRQLGRR